MMLRNRQHIAGLIFVCGLAGESSLGRSVTVSPLVVEGDSVAGVGLVTSVNSIAVNNSGDWLVEADTDHADTNADEVIIKNGVLLYRENQPIQPTGSTLNIFDSVRLNSAGNIGWNLSLTGPPTTADTGVFFNTNLIIQEGTFSTAPQLSPMTPYIGWFEVRLNDNNELLMVASVDDPAIATTVDRALVQVDYNRMTGMFTENALYKEGDILSGQTEMVSDFGTSEQASAFNNAGDIMFSADLTGDTLIDSVVYISTTLLAKEGSPSPVAGRNYLSLAGVPLDLNNQGGWVFRCTLSGDPATDLVLIKNNALFKSEGDAAPGVAGATLTSFGTGPVRIGDAGQVIWFGQWTGDTATNHGLFAENELLVRKGITQINGQTLTTVAGSTATGGISFGFAISPSGRFVIVRGLLNTTNAVAFMIDRCPADIFPGAGGDGVTNIDDLLLVIIEWGMPGGPADVNNDGVVNIDDLLEVILNWGPCP